MTKSKFGLFGKILVAIVGGILLGLVLGHPWVPKPDSPKEAKVDMPKIVQTFAENAGIRDAATTNALSTVFAEVLDQAKKKAEKARPPAPAPAESIAAWRKTASAVCGGCETGLNAFSDIFGQLLKFIVPLIILGLVTPAIAEMGSGAGKMLLCTVLVAYGSTVFAGYLAYFGSAAVFPSVLGGALRNLDKIEKAKPILEIPAIMPVMTALVLSFMLGLGIAVTKAQAMRNFFEDLRRIVSLTIEKVILPVLPFYIMAMIAKMGASGKLAELGVVAFKIIGMSIVLTVLLLVIQYGVACVLARRNPFRVFFNMLPAYFTALTICSSAASIPVSMRCVRKNGVSEEVSSFVVPLCATIHLAGSMTKVVSCAVAFMVLAGRPLDLGLFSTFIFLMAVTAVAAPGVAGGVITSSQGLLLSVLAFTDVQVGLLTTVYLAMDGLGTACNVTGDGAIALVVDRYFGRRATS